MLFILWMIHHFYHSINSVFWPSASEKKSFARSKEVPLKRSYFLLPSTESFCYKSINKARSVNCESQMWNNVYNANTIFFYKLPFQCPFQTTYIFLGMDVVFYLLYRFLRIQQIMHAGKQAAQCWSRVLHIALAPVSVHLLKSDNKELSNTLLPHLCVAGYMPEHCQRTVTIPLPLLRACFAFTHLKMQKGGFTISKNELYFYRIDFINIYIISFSIEFNYTTENKLIYENIWVQMRWNDVTTHSMSCSWFATIST